MTTRRANIRRRSGRGRAGTRHAAVAIAVAVALGAAARADDLRLEDGSTIRDVRIASVSAERVAFQDARGRADARPTALVAGLSFTAHPLAAQGESLLAAGAVDAAIRTFARALAAVPAGDPAAAWLRLRLLRVHAERGEATLARAHLLALVAADPDPAWGRLEPAGGDAETVAPDAVASAAREAHAALRRARAASDEPRIVALLDRIAARLPDDDGAAGPPTLSGIPRDALGLAAAPTAAPALSRAEPDAPAPIDDDPADDAGPTLEAIETLLAGGRANEAAAACERALRAPSVAGRPALLRAYGTALAAAGRDEEALLAFLRVGVLHARSRHAAPSLVAAADLYLRLYGDRAAAARLAGRAEALARDDDARAAARAARLRHDSDPGGS